MATVSDVRFEDNLFDRVEYRRLAKRFGTSIIYHIYQLRKYMAKVHYHGRVIGVPEGYIEAMADWEHDNVCGKGDEPHTKGELEKALLDPCFPILIPIEEGATHDRFSYEYVGWADEQNHAFTTDERSAQSRRAAYARHNKD